MGLALPGLLSLALVGVWGLRAHPRAAAARSSRPLVVAVFALLALVIVGGRVSEVGEAARMQTFLVIGTSIALEALPFVLLGAASQRRSRCSCRELVRADRAASAPLQVPRWRCRRRHAGVRCGSVPVARRLIVAASPRGRHRFMLAARIINPIVPFLHRGRLLRSRRDRDGPLPTEPRARARDDRRHDHRPRRRRRRLVAHARKIRPKHDHDHSSGRLRGSSTT